MKLIPLSKGLFTEVDDIDFEWLNQWKWYAMKSGNTFYAARTSKEREKILMHRLILDITKGKVTPDHIDRNGLNNKRNNLRIATRSQNNINKIKKEKCSSIFKGVCITNDGKKWQAHIQKDYKQIYLGCFETQIEAALAYNNAAKKLHGKFANLNLLSLPND